MVERGRRLEVIDTRGEAPASRPPSPPPRRRDSPAAPRTRETRQPGPFAHRSFTTHEWFDDKGPRTITLDAAGEARLEKIVPVAVIALVVVGIAAFFLWPILLGLLAILAGKSTREKLRAAATRQLDRFDSAPDRVSRN